MRLPIIQTIFRKEMLDMFRDRRTMISMLVVPLLVYPKPEFSRPAVGPWSEATQLFTTWRKYRVYPGRFSLTSATISGNPATNKGGGVFETASTITVQIAKITANTAPVDPDISGDPLKFIFV